ncbi:MAG: FHA domain-containing protein [Romboutsia sp.]
MGVYGIRMAIQSVEKELYDLEYSLNKEEIRKHGSNAFILTENIVKELVYIYSYLIYENNHRLEFEKTKYTNKLMFGQAISKLKYINDKAIYENKDIIKNLNRDYLVFDKENNLEENLYMCSKIRGKIFHEHGIDINELEEYRNEVKSGIKLSFKALKHLKEKEIFPTIVEFDSIVSAKEGDIIYFKDEINSKIPIKIDISDINEIKNTQWYIFRNSDMQTLIPIKNKIDTWNNDTIEPKIMDLRKENKNQEYNLGYLQILDENKNVQIIKEKTFIGRLAINDIQLTNRSISRRHCLIEAIDEYIYITDLDSKFGTYLNGIKLASKERNLLRDNDEISIGKGVETIKIIYRNQE